MSLSTSQSYKKLILGGPGAGKTRRLLEIMAQELAAGVEPERIAFVSFTKKAAREAAERAAAQLGLNRDTFRYCRTIHSLGFYESAMNPKQVVSDQHLAEFGEIIGCEFSKDGRKNPDSRKKGDRALGLIDYSRATGKDLRDVWYERGEGFTWLWLDWFRESYDVFKESRFLVDYSDMLDRYLREGQPIPVDVAIIDEAQDLSLLQWRVVDKAFSEVERLYIAGDDDQCHPPGTLIWTADGGHKPIQELAATDRIVSFDACGSELRRRGYRYQIAEQWYIGDLITVLCGTDSMECTEPHRCMVRWMPDLQRKNVVYLMRKGGQWRVGWCQLMRSDGVFHAWHRARLEGADDLWILRCFDCKREASLYESIVALRYQLPTMPFKASTGAQIYDQAGIDWFFCQLDRDEQLRNAHACLEAHGRRMDCPFVSQAQMQQRRGGKQTFQLHACNLISGLFAMAQPSGRTVTWKPAYISRRQYSGLVFSLNVEKHHVYFANGILTHNSIFGWSGADVETFLRLEVDEVENIPQSHRLAPAVLEYSQRVISRVRNRYYKEFTAAEQKEGQVRVHRYFQSIPFDEPGTWLVLGRTHYLLNAVKKYLRDSGYYYSTASGTSVNDEDVGAILAFERARKGKPIPGATANEVLRATGKPARFEPKTVVQFAELDLPNNAWYEVLLAIPSKSRTYYITARARGERLNRPPRIHVSTIHGVKGGEADHVVILSDMTKTVYKGYQQNPDDEYRVWYVGTTRSKGDLHIVSPTKKTHYPI